MKKPIAALTIDLDFWQNNTSYKTDSQNDCEKFLKYIVDLYPGEIKIYNEHDDMVFDINKIKKLNTVINIDQHNDLADDVVDIEQEIKDKIKTRTESWKDLHCGNWPYFLSNRKKLEYLWFHPENSLYKVRCSGYECSRFFKFRDYREISGIDYTILEDVDLKFVGVCYSREWVDPLIVSTGFVWLLNHLKKDFKKDVLVNDIVEDVCRRGLLAIERIRNENSIYL